MKHEFKELKIWQKARELNKSIYSLTSQFPKSEVYSLSSQLRRASVSIASNISEGSVYESVLMFSKYLDISLGSLCEVETQIYLANDIDYLDDIKTKEIIEETDHLKRMILSFKNYLKKSNN